MDKIVSLDESINISKKLRHEGKSIVLVGGCFDILHPGHEYFLTNAQKAGDILMVMLESDSNVKRLKGEGRPVNNQKKRAESLAKLEVVNYIILLPKISENQEYFSVVKKISPTIIAVTEGDPQLANKKKQAGIVRGEIIILKFLKEYSTSKIIAKTMRVFLAIDITENLKQVLEGFFKNVNNISEIKWERPEKLHLTLVFLGFVKKEKVNKIKNVMEKVVAQFKPFDLEIIPKLGGFPSLTNPRVLWIGIKGDLEETNKMVDTLQKNLESRGFTFDKRPFSAHLTLGRFREEVGKKRKLEVIKKVGRLIPEAVLQLRVSRVSLYQSRLSPRGSTYNLLHYVNFGD